jgi:hypothetical protein
MRSIFLKTSISSNVYEGLSGNPKGVQLLLFIPIGSGYAGLGSETTK